MDQQNIERLTSQITSIIESCDRDVADIAAASQASYKRAMPAGATVPAFGPFDVASDADREAVSDRTGRAYREIESIIKTDHEYHVRLLSEPASADDAATVALTLSRKHVTEEELVALLDRYEGNYQLSAAIREKAHEMGYLLTASGPTADVGAALSKAARLGNRYAGRHVMPASLEAEDIVDAFTHRDLFGGFYN